MLKSILGLNLIVRLINCSVEHKVDAINKNFKNRRIVNIKMVKYVGLSEKIEKYHFTSQLYQNLVFSE